MQPRRSGWVCWEGTKEKYALQPRDGQSKELVLGVAAGSRCDRLSELRADNVWNGAVRLAQLIEQGHLCCARKRVLELGAGAALPSLVLLAQPLDRLPSAVVISDYADPAIIDAMRDNVTVNRDVLRSDLCRVVGHTWGTETSSLAVACASILGDEAGAGGATGTFDVALLAEVMWNSDLHAALVETLCGVLSPTGEGWMCHCRHWEGHEAADAHFAAIARDRGLVVEAIATAAAEMPDVFSGEAQTAHVFRIRRAAVVAAERLATSDAHTVAQDAAASLATCPRAVSPPPASLPAASPPTAAPADAVSPVASLTTLPDDCFEQVCEWLFHVDGRHAPLRSLAALRASSVRLHAAGGSRAVLDRLAYLAGAPAGVVASIEQLAVRSAVCALVERGGALVGFEFAGTALDDEAGTDSHLPGSRAILGAWARLLVRHPTLRARIDAHCGITAPRVLAGVYSRKRGLSVAAELAACGVSMRRVAIAGWGKTLARRAAGSAHPNGDPARMGCGWAEVFVHWPAEDVCDLCDCETAGGLELPTRPGYYTPARGGRPRLPRVQCADDVSDGSEGSGDDDHGDGGALRDGGGGQEEGDEEEDSGPDAAEGGSTSGSEDEAGGQGGSEAEEEEAQLRRGLLADDDDEEEGGAGGGAGG